MRKALPILLVTMIAGCQDTSTSVADAGMGVAAATDADGHHSEWADNVYPCPLLGIPTTVRYEIQSGTERQYRVHLINTSEAPLAADCEQQPLPGSVVMRYRLDSRS
ncbi:MAG: hypothetical protein JJT88_13795 [Gammaproteobacteria bacterium]|nr:hypothetical protein [Gammaproteobacteria bacterium]